MTDHGTRSFNPDYGPRSPGEHLRRFLDARGIKIVDFARRTGRPTKTISEIISGKVAITPETAVQFERALGESASFWMALESSHQLSRVRDRETALATSEDAINWAQKFPIGEMLKLKLLSTKPSGSEMVEAVLRAFGVSSISAWDEYWQKRLDLSRFKQQDHNRIDPYAVAVWLRCAEVVSDRIETKPYSEQKFRSKLSELREMSLHSWEAISDRLVAECAEAGVAVALVPMVSNTGLRGAAYWARKDKAVIVLSDRLKREANVWFAFFHEACHILEHSKKAVFIDQEDKGTGERDIEAEADQFSAEILVPSSVLEAFVSTYGHHVTTMKAQTFKCFASQQNVPPGLLLTRLQHHKIIPQRTSLVKVKRRVEFTVDA